MPTIFMLYVEPHAPSGFALLCTTGSKAAAGETHAISRDWLIANWCDVVCAETDVAEIRVSAEYPMLIGDPEEG